MTNNERLKNVDELYGCIRKPEISMKKLKKSNQKITLKFIKKIFIKKMNEGYTAAYVLTKIQEWYQLPLTATMIEEWAESDKVLSHIERQNNAISRIVQDDFQHMERINVNNLVFKYEIAPWRLQLLIDMYMSTIEEATENE